MKDKHLISIFLVFVAILFTLASCQSNFKSDEQKIKEKLVGYEITYYNIAGKPINYTVKESDILSIENGNYKGALWKVRVGEALSWDIYLDNNFNIVRQEQLFRT